MRVGAYLLVVKRDEFRLEVWRRRTLAPRQYRLVDDWLISIGKLGHITPAGVYWVQARARYPEWRMPDSDWIPEADRGRVIPGDRPDDPHPENPIKAAFLKLTDDGVGIHGTDDRASLGTAASHGCIRVRPRMAMDLYRRVRKGTPVVIL